MNANKRTPTSRHIPRWLAAAGVTASLMVPLSASADHDANGAVEIIISAAVAYAVVDAIGGFDDKDRYDRRRSRDHYRDSRHDRYDRNWDRDRRYWAKHDHGHHDCDRNHRGHGHYHGKHHRKHQSAHRRAHHYRDHRRDRYTAYH
jgi:hypothetical protein